MNAPLLSARGAPELTDAQLVVFVLNGDDESYATLVRRHQQQIYRHARGMGLDHDTSLDLVQEALVKAFDHLEDCREGANYRSWLFRICRNLCLDELRNVRRRCVPMSAIENAGEIEDTRGAEDEMSLTLNTALERLPDALRETFLLKHDAGYTYEEVAEITGASPSAVKMRVHRAREALREFLSAQGVWGANEFEDGRDNPASAERLRNEGRKNQSPSAARGHVTPVSFSRRNK